MATPLHQLSESDLIRRLTQGVVTAVDVVQGIGDDCAVLDTGGPVMTVISTDALVEGVHFDPFLSPMPHIGWKAIAAAVSDVYAMFARPTVATVSLSASNRYTLEHLEQIYEGLKAACNYYGLSLVGGDITGSRRDLNLSITVLGSAPREQLVYRSGARVSELLCVSGDVGGAFAGLKVLQREADVLRENPDAPLEFTGFEHVVEKQLRPVPNRTAVEALLSAGIQPTSCIDISDGLASDANHLADASGVGFRMVQEQLPLHEQTIQVADDFNLPRTSLALYGGEEYCLLFTIGQADLNKLKELDFATTIGFATEKDQGLQLALPDGQLTPIEPMGWQHFSEDSVKEG